jgi:hypothetical protein
MSAYGLKAAFVLAPNHVRAVSGADIDYGHALEILGRKHHIFGEILWFALAIGGEVNLHGRVFGADIFQGDMKRRRFRPVPRPFN